MCQSSIPTPSVEEGVSVKGAYQFTESTDLENFKIVDDQVKMDFHPRHGTVLPITKKELNGILFAFGNS